MLAKGYRSPVALLALALAITVVLAIFRHVHGQAAAAPGAAPAGEMSGMDMPKPASAPAASATALPGYADVRLTSEVQQRIGVTLGRVERTPLRMTIRTVGIVQPNETKVAHVHLKTEGWVEKLYVSFTGQRVKAGEPMLSIYSPAFFAAQREFLSALQAAKTGLDQAGDQQLVVETARRRLELWDIPRDEIAALEKTGKPSKSLTLRSPISGTVLEKQVFAGQYVTAQNDLYVVADLSAVWMQARIFQYELPHIALGHIAVGMPATVSIASLPRSLKGRVVFIDPVVDEMSRSLQVRIELPNPDGQLRPGMFGDVSIDHEMGTGLTVPASAVIRTGERDVVFRAVSADQFAPVQVKINPLGFGDRFQVLEGLQAGDEVAVSGNFLIDSESRLEAGASSMVGMPGMSGGDTSNGSMASMPGMDGGKQPAVKQQ